MPTWPIIENALSYLQDQELIEPTAVAGVIRDSAIQAGALGATANQATVVALNKALRESVAKGESREQWRNRMRGIVGARTSYEETIGRTATKNAYREGQKKVTQGPAGRLFQYRQVIGPNDTRTRETHKVMFKSGGKTGKVYHKDSPMAAQFDALMSEHNCRHNERMLRRKEAVRIGIDDDTGWVEPVVSEIVAGEPVAPRTGPVTAADINAVYDRSPDMSRTYEEFDAELNQLLDDIKKLPAKEQKKIAEEFAFFPTTSGKQAREEIRTKIEDRRRQAEASTPPERDQEEADERARRAREMIARGVQQRQDQPERTPAQRSQPTFRTPRPDEVHVQNRNPQTAAEARIEVARINRAANDNTIDPGDVFAGLSELEQSLESLSAEDAKRLAEEFAPGIRPSSKREAIREIRVRIENRLDQTGGVLG